jgi:hypothetical protein
LGGGGQTISGDRPFQDIQIPFLLKVKEFGSPKEKRKKA